VGVSKFEHCQLDLICWYGVVKLRSNSMNEDTDSVSESLTETAGGDALPDNDENGNEINRLSGVVTSKASDPFDPDNLRIDQDYLSQAVTKKVIFTVPVKKPNKQHFVRVNPDPAYRLPVAMLKLKTEGETRETSSYIVNPRFATQLQGDPTYDVCSVTLFTYIDRKGNVGLWPATMPAEDGRQQNWHISALEAVQEAMTSWCRVIPNMTIGSNEVLKANGRIPEPIWSDVPPLSELLRIAFGDGIIDNIDHPALQKLRGEI
jgi:hypothetical protein